MFGLNRPRSDGAFRRRASLRSLLPPLRGEEEKAHGRKTHAGRTPIRGRRLYEHERSEGEDGAGGITSGPGLSGASGFRGRLDAGIPAAPGRGRTHHLDSFADVSTFPSPPPPPSPLPAPRDNG